MSYHLIKYISVYFWSKINCTHPKPLYSPMESWLNYTLARVTLWPETLWPRHFGQNDTLAIDTLGQRHFGWRDILASDSLASDTLANVTLARVTLWPVTLWPVTLLSHINPKKSRENYLKLRFSYRPFGGCGSAS